MSQNVWLNIACKQLIPNCKFDAELQMLLVSFGRIRWEHIVGPDSPAQIQPAKINHGPGVGLTDPKSTFLLGEAG